MRCRVGPGRLWTRGNFLRGKVGIGVPSTPACLRELSLSGGSALHCRAGSGPNCDGRAESEGPHGGCLVSPGGSLTKAVPGPLCARELPLPRRLPDRVWPTKGPSSLESGRVSPHHSCSVASAAASVWPPLQLGSPSLRVQVLAPPTMPFRWRFPSAEQETGRLCCF